MRERLALFESPALGDGRHVVRALSGFEALGQLFRYELTLVMTGSVLDAGDLAKLFDAPAHLYLEEDEQILAEVHGIVSEANVDPDAEADLTRLTITLVPRVHLLTHRRSNEVFLDQTMPDVLRTKLEGLGFKVDQDFSLALVDKYPLREIIVQHEETDLTFFSRLAEHLGITLLFEQKDGRDVVVLSDTPSSFQPIVRSKLAVKRKREHPAAWDVKTTLKRVPAEARVHDYNYRAPLAPLHEPSAIVTPGATGHFIELGPHTKNADETKFISKVRSEELAAQHHLVTGTTSEMSVRAGGTFTLTGHGNDQELLITEVSHHYRPSGGAADAESAWESRFTAIPVKTRFRPPRRTAWPRVSGLANAVVDGAIKGDYAELDEAGRYHLRMALDRSGKTDLGATHPVRMMQPHAGAHYGMHFPLRPGTEVLVGFVNGDPDRPIIVGAAPNPITSSPVDVINQTQNVLRTGSNNEVVMEDAHGMERIRIHTPHAKTTMQLGSTEEAEEGSLITTLANVSEASRLSNNSATQRRTVMAGSSTTLVGHNAVLAAGIDAIALAAERGMDQPSSVLASEVHRDLKKLALAPENAAEAAENEGEEASDEPSPVVGGALFSALGSMVKELGEQAVFEAVRSGSRTTDGGLDRAMGRSQGEALGEPMGPAAMVMGSKTAALMGRDTGLVFGDRVAALSSFHTASVMGESLAQLKSPEAIEVAGGREVRVTTAGTFDLEANLVRIVGGYYPEAEAPPLDEGTSVGVMSRRDMRFVSVEDCILICAQKNWIGTAHTGDLRLRAKKTMSLTAGGISASAGSITTKSSGDTKIGVDGDMTITVAGGVTLEAGGDVIIKGGTVTIEGGTITLNGPVEINGDLTVNGSINQA